MAEYDNSNKESNSTNNNTNDAAGSYNNADPSTSTNSVNNNQSQSDKAPEYSFWAEQVPNGSNSNYNPNMNSWEYNNNNAGRNNTYGNPNNTYGNQSNPYQNQNNPYGNQNNGYGCQSNPYANQYQSYGNQNNNQNGNYQNNNYQNNAYQYNPYQSNPYSANAYPNNAKQGKTKKERKPMNKAVKFMAKAVCFGLLAAVSFYGFQEVFYLINPDAASKVMLSSVNNGSAEASYEIGSTEPGTIKTTDKSVISEVANDTLPAIVSINCVSTQTTQWFGQSYDQEVEGSGSGIIVGKDEKELLIATNNHVVEGASSIKITFSDGTEADAIIKGTDSTADLAVVAVDITTLKDDTLNTITVAKLGSSDDVKVGEMVIAIGNALGYGQSVTVGYVSAKDREVEVSNGYNSNTMVLLQTDAAINPGNSGGALLNMKGEVIGINSVKYASSEVEGMGYAIPISKATPIINDLMTREVLSESEQGYLGISGLDVTEEVASYYNMPVGVYVKEVSDGGAAQKAGLAADDIITGADDIEITSISQLKEYVNSLRVGTEVKITYMRNTNGSFEKNTVTVTLGTNPNLSCSNN